MAKIRFRDSESKVVFDYPKAVALSGDADRVVFLSQRDFYLLLNSIEYIGKFRNRVYTSKTDEIYDICSDEQWAIFQGWVEQLENNLGGWPLSNEYLERIAIAMESTAESQAFIAQNTLEKVTWQDVINDLEATLGVSNIIYLVVKEITDLIPSLRIKLDGNKLIGMFWTMMTWNAPMLAAVKTIAASQVAQTALMGTAKTASILGAVLTGFGSLTNYYQGIRDAIFGGWSIMDFIASVLAYLIPDDDGGTGGDDPDNDPTNRTEVNVATTLINNNAFSCQPEINVHVDGCCCGGGATSGAYGPGVQGPSDAPPSSVPGTSYPPSFPDAPSYNVYKCKAANVVVLNLGELLYQIGSKADVDLSQYTTRAAAGHALGIETSLILYSGGTIPEGLAAWMTEKILDFLLPYPAETAVGLLLFEAVRLELILDREEAVCELYGSSSTGEARTLIEARIDGYIDSSGYTSDLKATAKEMYKGLLSNSFLGRLFNKDASINRYSDTSAIDCSVCQWYDFIFGTVISDDGTEIVIESVTGSEGEQAVILGISTAEDWLISLEDGSMTPPPTITNCITKVALAPKLYPVGCGNPEWDDSYATAEFTTFEDVGTVMYRSGSSFTIRIERV